MNWIRTTLSSVAGLGALLFGSGCETSKPAQKPLNAPGIAVIQSEFIYETAPIPSCHASTIAETADGLVAAWFGGKHERNPDVGIWAARRDARGWTAPVEVANGVQDTQTRFPCWNPVLFQVKEGPLLLFYKVGPSPSRWWGMLITSTDGGKTWGAPRRLPDGILGPIKNKPVALQDGTLLCPSSTEHDGWRVHLERTSDLGVTWSKSGPLNSAQEFGAIQPTILFHPNNRLQILCRSRQNVVTECWSDDGGKTWGAMKATSLPNPNSGIDAVTLRDGRHLLVYNPNRKGGDDRTPLVLGLSADGKSWRQVATLQDQPGEYSYPAIIQTRDGLAHITYTWKRQRVRHVVVDPAKLEAQAR
jgi:predicted neuraminidase